MSKGKVLILDDSEIVLESATLTLEEAGYEVAPLRSPFLLFKTMQRERPDVALVDVHMPALNGDRVLEIAHGIGAFVGTPVLLYSTMEDAELRAMAARHGADGFVRKSADREQLVSAVERWLRVGRARRQATPAPAAKAPAPRVVVCAQEDLQPKLQTSLLGRAEIERLSAMSEEAVLRLVREQSPRLLVLDGRAPQAPALIVRIREDQALRHISIAALLDGPSDGREAVLREAGANVVLSEWQSTPTWDEAFKNLLDIPPRRWVSFPVAIRAGAQPGAGAGDAATARNISVRGLLLEGRMPFAAGGLVNLTLDLGDGPPVDILGRVVWQRPVEPGAVRHGIEFVGSHAEALIRVADFVAGAVPA
jgi:CheY-like chemotaxis protein